MSPSPDSQILTVAQMRAAEEALISAGSSVEALMDLAGRGAADWVWRIAAHRPVTVLCGPGNNGGDGYVIAEALRERGGQVAVVAATEPRTDAARNARSLYRGEVLGPEARPKGEVLVDCLFGSGLTRALSAEHWQLLDELAQRHAQRIAIDVPSGVDSDRGLPLNDGLPDYDLTLALGAWKPAHFLMPASAAMGELRLVGIGAANVPGAPQVLTAPRLSRPAAGAHKYTRGLLAVVAGDMPGATLLACEAAQRSGAGYVKLLTERAPGFVPASLVVDSGRLSDAVADDRIAALLIGPGLGRGAEARERLLVALNSDIPAVIDADALHIAWPKAVDERTAPLIATPHEGELVALERAFGLKGQGSKLERARALAAASGMVIVAKGPDTVIAAPDGRLACAPRASSWLSVAGTGDVLAGVIASRLAGGADGFAAACQGVWLHAEAAHHCRGPFTAGDLATSVSVVYTENL